MCGCYERHAPVDHPISSLLKTLAGVLKDGAIAARLYRTVSGAGIEGMLPENR